MKAVIMAGGKGTRIASVRSDIPKPMIEVLGKPVLQYQIENLARCGIRDIIIGIGHLGSIIKDYFGNGSQFGVKITYSEEDHPLGTAGALFKIEGLTEDFIVLCGDTIFDIDFERFIKFHKEHNALATLLSHPNGHPYDSSILETEIEAALPGKTPTDTFRVKLWITKEDERLWYRNRVNAGIEILSPEILEFTKKNFVPRHKDAPDKVDLDRDVLRPAVKTGRLYAYDTSEYIKDMGTPDRYQAVEADIKSGLVQAKNRANKQKAVFLDRDGTINKDVGLLTNIEKLELLPGAAKAIKKINDSGYLAVVITNQPVIARGTVNFDQLQEIHNKLETLLGREGAYLDGIYYCPHHPDAGFAEERPEYKIDCECRKPKPGLIYRAAQDLNIDISQSFMLGDMQRDVDAGKNAGCKASILVNEGYSVLNFVNEYIENAVN